MRVGGIAKGSGMIHPNMATMLSVITSDAAVDESLWREIVRRGAQASFNQARPLPYRAHNATLQWWHCAGYLTKPSEMPPS